MLNANPTVSKEKAVAEVRRLHSEGFGSIRFNPYLWPEGRKVSWSRSKAWIGLGGWVERGHKEIDGPRLRVSGLRSMTW